MLIQELSKISGDVSLTPIKILTGWGTQKMRKFWLQLKNKFWKSIFTGIEKLEEGFYHKNTAHLGEMVIWDTQQVRKRGIQLTARGVASISYGETRDTLGITTVYHLIKAVPKPVEESTKKANETKSRQNLEQETGKTLRIDKYQDIITATQNMLIVHGTSLKDMENPGIGPQHEGLTRILSWTKKGIKTLLQVAKIKNKHRRPNKGL